MKISLPSVSIQETTESLAKAISKSEHGALIVTNLPSTPFEEMEDAFDHLASRKDITERLNKAYGSNLVYKDSFANGHGGPCVDMKRVLDLSPERLDEIEKNDPELMLHQSSLGSSLAYWEKLRTSVAPKIVDALSEAIGGSPGIKADTAFNYRMVDYYEKDVDSVPPRCGEHRDFGSFTLIFPSRPGLQIFADGYWKDVDIPSSYSCGEAIMLFGWVTQIRSNGRIPAALHRVADDETLQNNIIPRRVSAVFFCAPKHSDTPLEPVVLEREERKYITGITAGQLRGNMRRKWQKREGTLNEAGQILEEAEILATGMISQDDVVQKTLAV